MPTASNGATEIAYRSEGSGPALILIHGTGGSGTTTWSEIAPRLAADHTVVTVDLRGSGETVDDGGELKLVDLAADVGSIADELGLERFAVVGFSLGAAVAATLAAADPARVRALVLIAGWAAGGGARSRLQFGLWRDLFELDRRLFAKLWLLTGFSPGFVGQIPVEGLDRAATFPLEPGTPRQCELSVRVDLSESLERLSARALVVGCSEDAIVPVAVTRELAAAISAAEYVELDAGHMVVLESPLPLISEIERFLDAAGESA